MNECSAQVQFLVYNQQQKTLTLHVGVHNIQLSECISKHLKNRSGLSDLYKRYAEVKRRQKSSEPSLRWVCDTECDLNLFQAICSVSGREGKNLHHQKHD